MRARRARRAISIFVSARRAVHMAENALGVLLAATALGADVDGAAAALADFAPPKGRGERFTLASAERRRSR